MIACVVLWWGKVGCSWGDRATKSTEKLVLLATTVPLQPYPAMPLPLTFLAMGIVDSVWQPMAMIVDVLVYTI